jgi:glycosyltransferase involved in cell wall biosynthesis/uncharacterized membrane protein YbhN (UPF0104 family)
MFSTRSPTYVSNMSTVASQHRRQHRRQHRSGRELGRGLRFAASWAIAAALVAVGLPKVIGITWHGVLPALASLTWSAVAGLIALWFVGLLVHTVVLTAAAPALTHRRALTLNLTGSAISNVVPLGGAAGVELNRRMMRSWGLDARTFTGFTFLTNLWDAGAKLLLPLLAVAALAHAGINVTASLRTTSIIAGVAFAGLSAAAALLLLSARSARLLGEAAERTLRAALRLIGRDRDLGMVGHLLEVRRECAQLVARGWLRMSLGIAGYLALQCLLLGWCLHLTGAGVTWPEVLAGFAVERALTVLPVTPGGIGVADIGLVGVLLTLGGAPAGVAAAAVLYRAFVFAVEIPVGGGTLGLRLLVRRRAARRQSRCLPLDGARPTSLPADGDPAAAGRRIAHVTDVFLPRLGGIETHVDDLARHQRARGLAADVLTPPTGQGCQDPAWVRRLAVRRARRAVLEYDAVHVHLSMLSPYGLQVAHAAMDAGIPTLVTVHSMWTGAGAIVRFAARAGLRRWPVAWSAVSGAAASSFELALGSEVAVLPNAVDVATWQGPPQEPAGPPGAHAGERITLISVMRLMPRKRPLPLLRLFAVTHRHLPNVDLVIVGDGPLRRRMQRYVARHGLEEVVRFTGRLSRERVREELRAAAVYVAPAPRESFGLAALEARCAGLPVIAYRCSGVGEFVRDRVDGILIDTDAQLAAAMAGLAGDGQLRSRIAAHNGRVAPRQDWAAVLDATADLYRVAARVARVAEESADTALVPVAAAQTSAS